MRTRVYKTISHHLRVTGTGWGGKDKQLDVSLRDKLIPRCKAEVDTEMVSNFEWVDTISVVRIERIIDETTTTEELR